MKKSIKLIALLFITICANAQFNYQASLRDGNGDLLENQNVTFRTTITNASTTEYVETHSVTTTGFGIVNFKIGEGTVVSGDFSALNWDTKEYSLKVEVDIAGGSSFTDLGTTSLSVIPYAEHSSTANEAISAEMATVSETTNSVPSVTTAERDAIDLEVGKLVFNADENKFQGVISGGGSPILDQEMTETPTSGNAVDGTEFRTRTGQEFIATSTGTLTQIDVNITSVSSPGTFNFVLHKNAADYFNEIPAYTQSFNVTTAGWYEIELNTPFAVEANEVLVWSVEYISSGSIGIGRLSGDPYANGRSCTYFSCGARCCDLNFRSYIISSEPSWIDLH